MSIFARTDAGLLRPINQDCYYLPQGQERFAMVADGMGGHQAGEVASRLAVETMTVALRKAGTPDESQMHAAISEANRVVFESSRAHVEQEGMGTTLTAIWYDDAQLVLGHVGDSRAYLLRDGHIRQVTVDHTLVNELVSSGEITAQQARSHPQRHFLLRSLGTSRFLRPDVARHARRPGDVWLICSDGLSNLVEDAELESVLNRVDNVKDRVETLLGMALARGGQDNITLIVLTGEDGPR